MDIFSIPPNRAVFALRALKTVAVADGTWDDKERELLGAAAALYRAPDTDLEALTPIAPDDLAQHLVLEEDRLRLLQACIVMALADGDASPAEWRCLRSIADALEVADTRLSDLERVAVEGRRLAQADVDRRLSRGSVSDRARRLLGRVLPSLRPAGDVALEQRFVALASLGEGTLGRELHARLAAHGGPPPGRAGGPTDDAVRLEALRILTAYAADDEGDLLLAAFVAGSGREDPFPYLFFPMLARCAAGGARAASIHPAALLAAFERGVASPVDTTPGWDYGPLLGLPVAEARRALGLPS